MYHKPKEPTPEQYVILEQFEVDIEQGRIFKKGCEKGFIDPGSGYFKVHVGGRYLKRANIVWWKANGVWPEQMLDHRDVNRVNDRIDNLRYVTNSENAVNNLGGRKSALGLPKGVLYNPTASSGKTKPYTTTLIRKGMKIFLGRHATVEEAEKAYHIGLQVYSEMPCASKKEIMAECARRRGGRIYARH